MKYDMSGDTRLDGMTYAEVCEQLEAEDLLKNAERYKALLTELSDEAMPPRVDKLQNV